MRKKFSDLKAQMSPESRARAEARTKEMLAAADLKNKKGLGPDRAT